MARNADGRKHARHRTGRENHLELGFPHSDKPPRTEPSSPVRKTSPAPEPPGDPF
jgi:hypothetical protein